jgi:hypothetical protein
MHKSLYAYIKLRSTVMLKKNVAPRIVDSEVFDQLFSNFEHFARFHITINKCTAFAVLYWYAPTTEVMHGTVIIHLFIYLVPSIRIYTYRGADVRMIRQAIIEATVYEAVQLDIGIEVNNA